MKKVILFLITILIALLLVILSVSVSLKDIVIEGLNKKVVSNEISSELSLYLKDYDIPYEVMEDIELNVINSDSCKKITEKYFNNITSYLSSNEELLVPSIKDELIEIIEENDKFLIQNGIELTPKEKNTIVEKVVNSSQMTKVYKNAVTTMKNNLTDKENNFVLLFYKIIKREFRIFIISIIIILILLIITIKKSFYKSILNLSVSSLLAGIVLSFLLSNIIEPALNNMISSKYIDVNLNGLINIGYIYISLFAIFIVIYIFIGKLLGYKYKKYDY